MATTIGHERIRGTADMEPGTGAWARHVRRQDLDALVALHERLSPETLRSVYLTSRPHLSPDRVARLVEIDDRARVTHVAFVDDRLVGLARYEQRGREGTADATVLVDDAEQGRGIESLLLEHLAADARGNGIDHLEVEVLPLDQDLLSALEAAPFPTDRTFHCGVVTLTVHLGGTTGAGGERPPAHGEPGR